MPETRTSAPAGPPDHDSLVTERLDHTIDRDHYTPALLGLLSNNLTWGGSRVLRHLFGVGTNDWRIVSALGNHPGATASDLCEILGINKSVASHSVRELLERGFAGQRDGARGSRHLYLTQAGKRLHEAIMPVALKRQELIYADLSEEEAAELNRLLVRMLESSELLRQYEDEVLSGPAGSADDFTAP